MLVFISFLTDLFTWYSKIYNPGGNVSNKVNNQAKLKRTKKL